MSFVHLAGCDKRYFPGTATVVDCMCLLHSKHLICGPVLSLFIMLAFGSNVLQFTKYNAEIYLILPSFGYPCFPQYPLGFTA